MVEAEDRYSMAQAMRIAVNGTAEQMRALQPSRRQGRGGPDTEDDYDEEGLAEELASLGFVEVPPNV